MKSKLKPLTPPDPKRCQALSLGGSFMTFGPREYKRCANKPAFIATENEPDKDGRRGSMALCAECLAKCIEQLGPEHVQIRPLIGKKKKPLCKR